MNKKIYNAPEMEVNTFKEVMIIATSETLPVNNTPANNEMESKSISNFDFGFDEGLTNE